MATHNVMVARKYQAVWLKLIADPNGIVRVQVRDLNSMKRVRKAIWKEKDLDTVNRGKYRLNCEMNEKDKILEFSLKGSH